MMNFQNKIILNLLEKYQTIWALEHLSQLASWDLETYMPEAGAKARGLALAKTASLTQGLFLDSEFIKILKNAQLEIKLNDSEKGVVHILSKQLSQFEKLPKEFIENWQTTINQSQVVWRQAKKDNDFSLFAPYLEKIISLNLQKSELLGYKDHPYDVLLDEFEDGVVTKDMDDYFSNMKPFLQNLLDFIQHSAKFIHHPFPEKNQYDRNILESINKKVLKFLRQDPKRLRLDISTHPFTESMARDDVRITTAYRDDDFQFTIGATIHEFGHSLYETQIHRNLEFSPIGHGLSLGIHESQSRFWENFIGKSSQFIDIFRKDFDQLGFGTHSLQDYYYHFNRVQPNLVRIEADELTYHFHILIRFEIEKALLSRELRVTDVVEVWNQKYQDYLGVKPQHDSQGVLQDIHWSMGSMGYFPTYSTGTVLSAQWRHYLQTELGDIDQLIMQNNGIEKIQDWLKNKIHQFGATYSLKDLVKKVTGENFNIQYWKDYMFKKYHKIY